MLRCPAWTAGLALGLLAAPAFGAEVFKSTATGDPQVKSIDAIGFGPAGTLLIGDGAGSQVVAIATGDTTPKPWTVSPIDGIADKLAGRIGASAKDIEIVRLAVNPASGTAYIAARRLPKREPLVFTVDGSGKIGELALDNVKHVRLPLPRGEKAPADKVTDLAWADDRILVAAAAKEEFASKVYSIPTPLDADAKSAVYSTETYHVAHGKWETRAPISSLIPYEEDGKKYVVGAFACTPLVKYPLDELQSGAKVKGMSVAELGSGNQPLHMFTYEKDGKGYVLMNTRRFHHKRKPFGPSEFWTAKLDLSLLGEKEKINEKALLRLKGNYEPATDRIQLVEAYHGVMQMDKLGKDKAVVLQEDGKGALTLKTLALP